MLLRRARRAGRVGALALLASLLSVPLAALVAPPALAAGQAVVSGGSVTEGTGGTSAIAFNVTVFNIPAGQCASLAFSTANLSATAGSDYTAVSQTLLFLASGTQFVSVPVATDAVDEPNESFSVAVADTGLCPPTTFFATTGTGTIIDDDAAPTASIGDVTQAEGTGGTTPFSFPVTLSGPSQGTLTLAVATADGTATAADYTPVATTVTFSPGDTAETVVVQVTGDNINEVNEVFTVNLSNSQSSPGGLAAVIGDGTADGTVLDDDDSPVVTINDVAATEGAAAVFTISRSSADPASTTVQFATANGSAAAGSDYTATAGTATIPAGQLSTTVSVPTLSDGVIEGNQTFVVNLTNPTNGLIIDGQGVGTITEATPTVDFSPQFSLASAPEGNAGSSTLAVPIALSATTTQDVVVTYTTGDFGCGSCGTPGVDFAAVVSAQVTIPAGQTAGSIPLTIFGDIGVEPSEFAVVRITAATNAAVAGGLTDGFPLIRNDDGLPNITISDVGLPEGTGGGANPFTFTISLSAAQPDRVLVDVTTADGSAAAGPDYDPQTQTVVFSPGQTSRPFTVNVARDNLTELNETFFANLSNPRTQDPQFGGQRPPAPGGTITDGQGLATILNDDGGPPTISVADVSQAEGNATNPMNFTVSLSGPTNVAVTGTATTANGTAASGSDFGGVTAAPFTIPAGATSTTVTVSILGDTTVEPSETFTLNLANVTNAAAGDLQALGTIANDDSPAVFVNDAFETEGTGAGTTTLFFNLTLNGPAPAGATVTVATANGTATAPGDYTAVAPTVVPIPVGTMGPVTVTVDVVRDAALEPNETLTFNVLATSANLVVGDGTGVGTIVNDDGGPPPVVTGLAPNNGPAQGGTQVTIVGTNLTTATQVTINSQPVMFFVSGPNLVFTTPFGFPGGACVQVTTPSGTSACTNGSTFTYV